MNREQEMYFDQCIDFLARMIENTATKSNFLMHPSKIPLII